MDLEGEQRRFLRRAVFAVEGMTCAACSGAVETALRTAPGVAAAQASALAHSAEASFDERATTAAALIAAVVDAGFGCTLRSEEALQPPRQLARLRVGGMTCSSCSSAVESALAATPGVRHAVVSLTLQEAKVEFDPEVTNEVSTVVECTAAPAGEDQQQCTTEIVASFPLTPCPASPVHLCSPLPCPVSSCPSLPCVA
jgi:copper ion binding protein